jgi:hypothetical protein
MRQNILSDVQDKRREAVTFLKEITNTCGSMTPDSVTIFHSKMEYQDSVWYQVHIKTVLDSATKQRYEIFLKNTVSIKRRKRRKGYL